jgi:hypothetical protein
VLGCGNVNWSRRPMILWMLASPNERPLGVNGPRRAARQVAHTPATRGREAVDAQSDRPRPEPPRVS